MRSPRLGLILALFVLAVVLCPGTAQAVTQTDVDAIWLNNGAVEGVQEFRFGWVDWRGGSVSVTGEEPVRGSSPGQKLLARRAALTDARRNLLLLLYEIRYGLPEKLQSIEISGEIGETHIDSERISNKKYIVELTVPLDVLLNECVIFSAEVR